MFTTRLRNAFSIVCLRTVAPPEETRISPAAAEGDAVPPSKDIAHRRYRASGRWVWLASILCLALVALGTRPGRTAEAEKGAMPPVLQAVLFKKIFGYNKKLPPVLNILVLYAKDYSGMAEDVRKRMEKPEVHVEVSAIEGTPTASRPAHVVYILSNNVPAQVKDYCQRERVFSVSPIPTLAERGDVSVAIGLKADNKPEIIVNLIRSKQEGQELELALLSLARIIR